jgi:hypothetical protein
VKLESSGKKRTGRQRQGEWGIKVAKEKETEN